MNEAELVEPELSRSIVGAFLDSYYKLGYGFLESIYCNALGRELTRRQHSFEREPRIEVMYDDGGRLGAFRIDFLVERRIVVEVKASEVLPNFAKRQLLNYLRATNVHLGLILHYGPTPRFYRVVSTARPGRS